MTPLTTSDDRRKARWIFAALGLFALACVILPGLSGCAAIDVLKACVQRSEGCQ